MDESSPAIHSFGGNPLDTRFNSTPEGLQQQQGTIQLKSPFGIPLFVTYTAVGLVAIMLISYAQLFQTDFAMALGLSVLGSVMLFVSVVAHEYGHGLMSTCLGGGCKAILIDGFGGLAFCDRMPSAGRSIAVSAAGPATHLVWMVISAIPLAVADKFNGAFAYWTPSGEPSAFGWNFCADIWRWQFMMLVFNAVPWLPGNDASHIVQTLVGLCNVHPKAKVFHVSWCVNVLFTIGLGVVWFMSGGGFDFSLIWIVMLWGYFGYNEYQLYKRVLESPTPFEPLYQAPRVGTSDNDSVRSSGGEGRTILRDGVLVRV